MLYERDWCIELVASGLVCSTCIYWSSACMLYDGGGRVCGITPAPLLKREGVNTSYCRKER